VKPPQEALKKQMHAFEGLPSFCIEGIKPHNKLYKKPTARGWW
jgi:hypothetical protein